VFVFYYYFIFIDSVSVLQKKKKKTCAHLALPITLCVYTPIFEHRFGEENAEREEKERLHENRAVII